MKRKSFKIKITDMQFHYAKSDEVHPEVDINNISIKFNEPIKLWVESYAFNRVPKIIIPSHSSLIFHYGDHFAGRNNIEVYCGDNCKIVGRDNLKLVAGKKCSINIGQECDLDLQKKCIIKYFLSNDIQKYTKVKFKGSVTLFGYGYGDEISSTPIKKQIISKEQKTIYTSSKKISYEKLFLTEDEFLISEIIT